jgi:hypothetical protein
MVWILEKEETRALTGSTRTGENGEMEAPGSSKTMVCIYQIAQCHVPENCDLDIQHCENLKSHLEIVHEFLFGKRKGHPSKVIALTC